MQYGHRTRKKCCEILRVESKRSKRACKTTTEQLTTRLVQFRNYAWEEFDCQTYSCLCTGGTHKFLPFQQCVKVRRLSLKRLTQKNKIFKAKSIRPIYMYNMYPYKNLYGNKYCTFVELLFIRLFVLLFCIFLLLVSIILFYGYI